MRNASILITATAAMIITVFTMAVDSYWDRMHSAPIKFIEEYRPETTRVVQAKVTNHVQERRLSQQGILCLAYNIYHEARGEALTGRIAVGHVVLNRMRSARFPNTACDVIKQGGERRRYRCQFSWWCDGRSDRPKDLLAWWEALSLASLITKLPDPTGGALWYHADTVRPYWADVFKKKIKIGKHIFYVLPKGSIRIAKK